MAPDATRRRPDHGDVERPAVTGADLRRRARRTATPHAVATARSTDFPQDGTSSRSCRTGDALHVDPGCDPRRTLENGSIEPDRGPRAASTTSTACVSTSTVPAANCALLSFRFLTDEAPGAEFNDGFIAELDTRLVDQPHRRPTIAAPTTSRSTATARDHASTRAASTTEADGTARRRPVAARRGDGHTDAHSVYLSIFEQRRQHASTRRSARRPDFSADDADDVHRRRRATHDLRPCDRRRSTTTDDDARHLRHGRQRSTGDCRPGPRRSSRRHRAPDGRAAQRHRMVGRGRRRWRPATTR